MGANPAFSPRDAARAIADAERYETGLVNRTEGITWMIWGLVVAGIFVSYAAAYRAPEWALALLWVAWVAPGGLVTGAIWHSAALSAPSRDLGSAREGGAIGATFLVLFLASFAILWFLRPPLVIPSVFLTVSGLVALLVALAHRRRLTPAGRKVIVAVAAVTGLAGAALLALSVGYGWATVVAALVGGGSWLAGGLWQTFRG